MMFLNLCYLVSFSFFCFFFNDTATTEIYTLSYTTLFRSKRHDRSSTAMPLLRRPHDHCRGLCPRRRTARPALRRWHPHLIPMTVLPVPWQHPFARTFGSRRRHYFTLVPANTGTTSRTSPRSGHRAPQRRPPRCLHRRSALGHFRKTIHGYTRSDVKSP